MSAGRLILMGSGETAGPLVAAHRLGLEAAGADRVLLLDTPYGFQENASLISRKLARFFGSSLRVETETVSYRSPEAGAVARERMLAAARRGRYVFAGPGSPTYALGVWRNTGLNSVLRDLLSDGATVTFASAAALTAGKKTLPVYDIYKVGAPLGWLDGLDLTSRLGLEAVFVPHWNNAEGQGFDTSRCYMGVRRFDLLRSMLPPGLGIIGVDEHTAAVIDFGREDLAVMGVGTVTVQGREETTLGPGESLRLEEVNRLLENDPRPPAAPPSEAPADLAEALASRSAEKIAGTLLEVESKASGGRPRARQSLRAMLVEISELAASGLVAPVEWVGGYVELLVEERARLRTERQWEAADRLRSGLRRLGVTLEDTPSGTEWTLQDPTGPSP